MSRTIPAMLEPVTADDAQIAEALQFASVPVLIMSLVHLTGDTSLLHGSIRPGPAALGETRGQLSEEDKTRIRELALSVICQWRDDGCKIPPTPSPETLLEMMRFLVGAEVPEGYVPMMLEEMALDGADSRDLDWEAIPREVRQRFRVLVIGAGMSGLLAAIRLEDAGIPYVVVEKNESVGGTWFENSYPGCRVDVANHFYCYSFEPNPDWSEFFSRRDELHDYFERCADKYGVREHIRFRTEVVSARFGESSGRWQIKLRGLDGATEMLEVNAVISGVGQLNRPFIPELPGIDSFQGESFHSAAWRHDVDLAGLRVASLGTGASAMQLVPEVAKVAGQLFVFQRSPGWMLPNPVYHQEVTEGKRWLLRHLPYYGRWYRFLLFWPGSDGLMPSLVVDPEWKESERSINAINEATREHLTRYMASQLGDDPDLLDKVTPRYPPFGKRILQDNGNWLKALTRDNVELVAEGIREVTPTGVITQGGEAYDVDVIVYATGFHANKFLWPMDVVGRDGLHLGEHWGDDPSAYLGITVPGFPNLFCLYGPGTNLAHAGSIIFHSECQVRYIMGCFKAMLEREISVIECKPEVLEDYDRRFQERHRSLVWSHPGMDSWYKNKNGRVTTVSPWLLRDYWSWTREPNLDDFILTSV